MERFNGREKMVRRTTAGGDWFLVTKEIRMAGLGALMCFHIEGAFFGYRKKIGLDTPKGIHLTMDLSI